MKVEYLIIGAGITGVTFARLLQQSGNTNFCLLEKNSEPGGLCRSKNIAGHVLDLGGGHFFHTKYPEVSAFVFSHIPREEFNHYHRVSQVRLEGLQIDFPLESHIWQLPNERREDYFQSLLAAQRALNKTPGNFLEWIQRNLGGCIARDFMIPYNEKIWGVPPAEMDIDWLDKIPRLTLSHIQHSMENRFSGREHIPSHSTFYYPKNGGFQRIFDALCAPVHPHIVLNTNVERIQQMKGGWRINDAYECTTLINTAPWPSLLRALEPPKSLDDAFGKLKANSVAVSLCEADFNHDAHWIYEPDPAIRHHREFFIRNFSPESKTRGIFVETNGQRWKKGAIVGRYNVPPLYEYLNETAYPIPLLGHRKAIETIRTYYARRGLYGLGRWGQWKYLNADVCIREVMVWMSNILRISR